jgi:hypothetical protein
MLCSRADLRGPLVTGDRRREKGLADQDLVEVVLSVRRLGAVIEAPLLAWFVSEQGYLNVSALFVALFHMPGYLLAYPLIA